MKNIITIAMMLVITTSCTKDALNLKIEAYSIDSIANEKTIAEAKFAKVLSRAIYENEKTREFIKNEALKQFDNDYDIFYPLIKDKIVYSDITFRDVVKQYISEQELLYIETKLPLLNIYIPDFSAFKAISAENLDTKINELPVAVSNPNGNTDIYINGNIEISLSSDEVPAFHLLLIKSNERVRKSSGTRNEDSSLMGYEFIDPVFDGYQNKIINNTIPSTKTSSIYTTNYIPKYMIDNKVINGWHASMPNSSLCQRDNFASL